LVAPIFNGDISGGFFCIHSGSDLSGKTQRGLDFLAMVGGCGRRDFSGVGVATRGESF
jgi:hypothetical protein